MEILVRCSLCNSVGASYDMFPSDFGFLCERCSRILIRFRRRNSFEW
jgi:hypothetical protein